MKAEIYNQLCPHRNQNRRRGWTSASCTRTPLAWWPRWDRRVDGPLGCSHLFQGGDWLVGRQSEVFPLGNAGWRGGGCAWRRPESAGCLLTCSRLNWPEPGYHGSSAHRLGRSWGREGEREGGRRGQEKGTCYFFKAQMEIVRPHLCQKPPVVKISVTSVANAESHFWS